MRTRILIYAILLIACDAIPEAHAQPWCDTLCIQNRSLAQMQQQLREQNWQAQQQNNAIRQQQQMDQLIQEQRRINRP